MVPAEELPAAVLVAYQPVRRTPASGSAGPGRYSCAVAAVVAVAAAVTIVAAKSANALAQI